MANGLENGRGNIVVVHGSMFCGKTRKLVEEFGNGEGVIAFRPEIDNRYGEEARIYSKSGESAPAVEINHQNPWEIYEAVEQMGGICKVIIDEASFFPIQPFLEVVDKLATKIREVVVGGLAYDAERKPWGPILELLKWPEVTAIALTARCDGESGECQTPAIWSYAKVGKKEQLEKGGAERYGASCEKHYLSLHVPRVNES